jgi:AcrR family transcriptional regulator
MDVQQARPKVEEFYSKKMIANPDLPCYYLTNWLINMASAKTALSKPRMGSRGRPEESRAAILKAAIAEFSKEGVAGARTDAIARAAKVNKALLYYYFKDKETLHGEVLDQVFGGLTHIVGEALSRDLPPKEKLLSYIGAHFDYIASHPLYPRIAQSEMMSASKGRSGSLERIAKHYFRPIFMRIAEVLEAGMASGDFRRVDPTQFIPSMIAIIVFYFTSAPIMKIMNSEDPLSPERIAARRAAVLEFISTALFRSPKLDPKGARS